LLGPHKAYPHGVGRTSARDKTSGTPVTNFKVSNCIYTYNDGKAPRHAGERDLDRDNDGIACEKR
jgi:Excalibur calcium-binding domain